jgi:MoxR-like ATPase
MKKTGRINTLMDQPENIQSGLAQLFYLADEELSTILYLMYKIKKPLLLEGQPGVGKTDVAIVLSKYLDTDLIRLQCYEGLDIHHAVYEWNYQKQLLSIKLREQMDADIHKKEAEIFGPEYLLERPLLQAISFKKRAPVLLIDEIDRADEEFEAYLLELLSAFQISIPEIGTIAAKIKPLVILTSNRTRELSDALKRRCLYHWISFPDFERELEIISTKIPDLEETLSRQIVSVVQKLRKLKLSRPPGIAETLDWAQSLLALSADTISEATLRHTLGCLVKTNDDIQIMKEEDTWNQILAEIS